MNARIDHRICWRVIGLMLFSALLSVTAPAFSCTAYAVEEGADNGVVERDSTGGPGALVGGGCSQDSSDCAGKTTEDSSLQVVESQDPSTTEKLMTGLGRLCETYDLPVQSHLSENRNEVAWVKELHPDLPSYTAVYDTFGLLRPEKTIMAHAIYLSDEEKRLLRDKGVYLAHCAQSNANLTSGIMPLRRNLENGLTCTIASDVAAGHTPAMNKQIALTIEISKLYSLKHDREKALTIGEGLYLATKGPGRFYGRTGSFEKGYAFDALVIHMDDIEGLERTPFEKLQQFIYDGDDRNIIARYVDGVSR